MGVSPSHRSRIAIAGLCLATVGVLSSCSSVTQDAARVGGESFSDSDFQDLLEGYTVATQSGILPSGNVDGAISRLILLDWISSSVLEETLDEYGVEVTQADLDDAMASLEDEAGFADAPRVVKDFYSRATAVRTVAGSTFTPSPEELADLYAAGPAESGLVCLRIILTDERPELDAALARIEAGESFADVAREVSTDSSAQDGGILRNSQSGDECFPFSEIVGQIVEQIAVVIPETRPNVVTDPIEVPEVGWVALVLRPFTEIADEAERVIGPVTATRLVDSALETATVWVNPVYGTWDTKARKIVPGQ